MNNNVLAIARFFIGIMFIVSAIVKIFTLDVQVNLFTLLDASFTMYIVIISILVELLAGIMFIVGYKVKFIIIVLVLFLIGNTIMAPSKFDTDIALIIYKKNIAILGGLLAILHIYTKK